ncbi:hypothetical protein BDF21DRAFT_462387 [Thamnidium elegans]|nr:hypothetical protein BDF21DRAFT_462387 [Thamnidium elegans]
MVRMCFQTIFIVLLAVMAIFLQYIVAETSLALVTNSAVVVKRSTFKQNFMRYLNCNYEHVDANRPFCVTLKSKIHVVEHKYYSSMFKVKFWLIKLFDYLQYDLMASDAESYLEPTKLLYSRLEMELNHNMIREKQRSLSFFERRAVMLDQKAWVRDRTDVYWKIESLILEHMSNWSTLMCEWQSLYNYYLYLYPNTGLDEYELHARDLMIFQKWSLQLYKSKRMFRNQKREIHDLIPEYLKHSLNSSDPSYSYYNDTQSKILWNTLALVEKNLNDVSNEFLFSLYNSFGTVQYDVPVGVKQEYPMVVGNVFDEYAYKMFWRRHYVLLRKLKELWIKIPSTSERQYFIQNSSKWEKTKYLALEISTFVTDIVEISGIVEKIQRTSIMDMMDQGVERLRKQLNKNSCDFLGLRFDALGLHDFQRRCYCKVLRKALVMVTDVYRFFRKKNASCECMSN